MKSEVELAEVITDIAAGPFGSNLKASCFVPSGFPIIDGANLKGLKVTDNLTKFVTEEKARSLSRSIARRGDVVVTISGTIGQIAYIPEDSMYEEYLCSQRQFKVTFDSTKVYVPYLVFYFHTREGQGKILAFANQTGVPALAQPTKNFKKIRMPLPSLEQQKRISSIAELLTSKIEVNAKLNGYLEELAQTIYNDWFRDFGHWGGQMPSHWETGVLGDYVTVKRGGSPRPIQEYLSDEGLRWLKIADVSGISGPYILEIKEHIKEEGLRKTVHLEPGSLVLSNSATPGIPKILSIDTCIHDGWLYFPQSQFTNEWLYCYFLNVRQELVRMANGSVFQNLKTDIVKNFEVIRPDDETLASFQEMVAPLFNLMESCQKENKQLADLRDTLLPKLMSGEIDVSKVDLTQLNSHLA